MKKSVIICIAVLLAAVIGVAVYIIVKNNRRENKEADSVAAISAFSYDIDLKLDTEKERLEQTVLMEIANRSDDDFSSLYIRYYPNGYIGFILEEIPEERETNEGRSSGVTSVTWKGSEKELKLTYDLDDTLIKVDLEEDAVKYDAAQRLFCKDGCQNLTLYILVGDEQPGDEEISSNRIYSFVPLEEIYGQREY